jgi:FtsP/CotA-like multicopper oxidase with cupredoxin domain
MLTSYHAVVAAGGQIRLTDPVQLSPGTEVLVVVVSPSQENVKIQEARLAAMAEPDWQAPFVAYAEALAQEPPEVDINTVSDEELVELVHQVRAERKPSA